MARPSRCIGGTGGADQQVLGDGAEQLQIFREQGVGDPHQLRLGAGRLQHVPGPQAHRPSAG
ncbi:MAG: hypothetical protein ACRD1T_16465, partial [Acidimicrobiia bacterium]